MTQPNILMIMTDQHRFDRLSCMGDPLLRTPNIDSIAEAGVLFSNAYTPSPVCSPARAAIKSGMYPPGCGVVTNWVPFKEGTELLTHRLQQNGYTTAVCGKLHFVPHRGAFGFDHKRMNDAPYSIYADDDRYSDYIAWLRNSTCRDSDVDPVQLFDEDERAFKSGDWYRFIMGSAFRKEQEHDIPWVVDESIRFLTTREKERPFFLFTGFFGPHQPFAPPEPWNSMYDPESIQLPPQFDAEMRNNPIFQKTCAQMAERFKALWTPEIYREMIAAYYGQVAMIDHYVGKLFHRLKTEGLWDSTLIVFVSDHGDHNGAYGLFFKGQMYDSCCKVPLLIKPPHFHSGGVVRDEVVNTLDLYGTLLDTAGDVSWQQPHIEARSLMPLLSGPERIPWSNETFSIIGSEPGRNLTMLRRDDLKLVRLACGDDEPLYELYDMNDSIVEVRNVFDDPRYESGKERLKTELDAWWTQQARKYPDEIESYMKA